MKRGLVIGGVVVVVLLVVLATIIFFFSSSKNSDLNKKPKIDTSQKVSGLQLNLGYFDVVEFNDPAIELVYFSNLSQILGDYSAIYYDKKNNEIIKLVVVEYDIELGLPDEEYSQSKTIYCGKSSYTFLKPVIYNSLIHEDYNAVFRHNLINVSDITCSNIVRKEIILPLKYFYNIDTDKISKLNKIHNLSSVAISGDFQTDKSVNFSYLSYDRDKIIIKEIQGMSYSNILGEIRNSFWITNEVNTTSYSGGEIITLAESSLNVIYYIKECNAHDFILIEIERSRDREKTLKDVIDLVNC